MENAKIVVIDDDPDIRDSLQTILARRPDSRRETRGRARRNYTVATAADRNEGMEKNQDRKSRFNHTGCGHVFVAGRPRSRSTSGPILMLTGVKEQTGFDFKPKEGGPEWCSVDAYLDKPVDTEVLLEEVEILLSERA